MARTHFHFRLGNEDIAAPAVIAGAEIVEVPLIPNQHSLGHSLGGAIDELRKLGVAPTEIGVDFLLLGGAVLAADKNVDRRQNAEDSWTREIGISLPVSDPARWNGLTAQITKALDFLTGDRWQLDFRPRPETRSTLAIPPRRRANIEIDRIALLSGGLDSFIGAIDLLEEGHRVLFASHSAVSSDSGRQRHIISNLANEYPGTPPMHMRGSVRFRSIYMSSRKTENTERSRSFLFFSLAALAATALPDVRSIIVPENGLISLNVPLEELRLGSLSTRTTHPFFMARMNEIFCALGIGVTLSNPYQFKTKGEMVSECKNRVLLAAGLRETISCSSPNSVRIQHVQADHCGYCMPCIIRRAALLDNIVPDSTRYGITDLRAQPLSSNRPRGEHVRAFQSAILRLNNSALRASILAHESGPLNDCPNNYSDFAGVYLRGLQEVDAVLTGVVTRPDA